MIISWAAEVGEWLCLDHTPLPCRQQLDKLHKRGRTEALIYGRGGYLLDDKFLERRERDLAALERWLEANPQEDRVVRYAVWERVQYLKVWIRERKRTNAEGR